MTTRRMFISRTCADGYASSTIQWRTHSQTTCGSSGAYPTRAAAEAACTGGCYGIYDPGCDGAGQWHICGSGSPTWTTATSDCVYAALRDTICYECPTFGLSRLTSPVTSCEYCPGGRVGPPGMTAIGDGSDYLCLACEAGKYRGLSTAAGICTDCTVGQFAAAAASTCSTCDAGRVPNTFTAEGASSCVSCAAGRAPNQNPVNTMNPITLTLDQYPAQTTCEDCTGLTFSEVGYACQTCAEPNIVNDLRM